MLYYVNIIKDIPWHFDSEVAVFGRVNSGKSVGFPAGQLVAEDHPGLMF